MFRLIAYTTPVSSDFRVVSSLKGRVRARVRAFIAETRQISGHRRKICISKRAGQQANVSARRCTFDRRPDDSQAGWPSFVSRRVHIFTAGKSHACARVSAVIKITILCGHFARFSLVSLA